MKNPNYQLITADKLNKLDPNNSVVLDVRTKEEIAQKSLAQKYIHEALDQLHPESFIERHGLSEETEICILCHIGQRARYAAEMLATAGCKNIKVIEGGILSCEAVGCKLEGGAVKKD